MELFFTSPPSQKRWWSKNTVAIVTGANKGIGFAIVKRLAELGVTVILAARDPKRGQEAADSLRTSGLSNVHFLLLDITNPTSIQNFSSTFVDKFGALDILVNNAAVSFNGIHENSVEKAEIVIKTNFYGTKLLTEALLNTFRRSNSRSRILNISSRLGSIGKVKNPTIRAILENENLKTEQIDAVVNLFLQNVKSGSWMNQEWPEYWTDYAVSKVALNAYSRVLAKTYEGHNLSVNCFCPGFTQTSMTGGKGSITPEDAATAIANLALLPVEDLPTGKFFLGKYPASNSRL